MNIENLYDRNIDIEKRAIFFCPWQGVEGDDSWGVSDTSVQNMIKGLYLLNQSGTQPIKIIWNADGGEWAAGMALYDIIKAISSHITMQCYGRVRSMGTLILQACDKRLLSPNCQFLMHYGDFKVESESRNAIADAMEEKRCNEVMEKIYLDRIKEKHTMFTTRLVKNNMECNQWLTPDDVIILGLADEIIK